MSGEFSFPPPPPPPPRAYTGALEQSHNGDDAQGRGRGRGRGGARGDFSQRGRGDSRGHGNGSFNGPHQQPWSGRGNWRRNPQQNRGPPEQQPVKHDSIAGQHVSPDGSIPRPSAGHSYQHQTRGSSPQTTAGHKRKLDTLRGPQSETERVRKPGPLTAPVVPGFGPPIFGPHPGDLPKSVAKDQALYTKPRLPGRGLGLVPTAEDNLNLNSDTEEEKDVDEEAMHAELGDKLTFEHDGVIMALKSQADLAAWKKERQRKWPTEARMAERERERRQIGEERRELLARAEVLPRPSRTRSYKGKAKTSDVRSTSHLLNPEIPEQTDISVGTASKPDRDSNKREQRLAELRKKVAESEASNRQTNAQDHLEDSVNQDYHRHPAATGQHVGHPPPGSEELLQGPSTLQVETEDDDDGPNQTKHSGGPQLSHERDIEPSELSGSSSEVSPDSDSSDSSPEEIASKPAAALSQARQAPICRYFAASGWCRDGDACRYRHELPARRAASIVERKEQQTARNQKDVPTNDTTGGRKTIFQRLIEQEQSEEDRLALQIIKHLGKVGFFRAKEVNATIAQAEEGEDEQIQAQGDTAGALDATGNER